MPVSNVLSSVEQSLVAHVCSGEPLDLIPNVPKGETVDEDTMRSWGPSQTCSATVIRDILRGRLAADPDPHGLRLRGARISGRLDLENLTTDVNLELSDCLLKEGINAQQARVAGVDMTGCQIEHPTKPPLDAEGLACSVLVLDRARITGHAGDGAVSLLGAHIGSLDCDGADLRNDSGPALLADALQVDQSMYLIGEFTGSGDDGAVRLLGARIGGQLGCDGAKLRNNSGPALNADSLQVGRSMYLTGEFTGSGGEGAVRLLGARIGGNLGCTGAKLRNDSGPALYADSLQVDQGMFLTDGFTATAGGSNVAVNLTAAQVGAFLFAPSQLKHATDPHRRLAVDGLAYAGVPLRVSARDWLDLLREGTPRYAAQPYQQLAAGCRAQGDERAAREVLMAQRDDQLARARPRPHWTERLWGKITKVTLGYGYKPWRALWFLAAVVAISVALAVVLGAHGALAQTKDMAAPGQPCTVTQRVSVGLDLNLPVGTSLARAGCGLPKNAASATAAWLTITGWVLRVLAWAFAALFIAGFTGAVRKT